MLTPAYILSALYHKPSEVTIHKKYLEYLEYLEYIFYKMSFNTPANMW